MKGNYLAFTLRKPCDALAYRDKVGYRPIGSRGNPPPALDDLVWGKRVKLHSGPADDQYDPLMTGIRAPVGRHPKILSEAHPVPLSVHL